MPDPSAHVCLPAYEGRAPFDLYLCDSLNPDGTLQYKVTTAPATGLAAADRAILTREVIREVAR